MGNPQIGSAGNVYFAPGTVKSINVRTESSSWDGHYLMHKMTYYDVTLSDGTQLSYREQMATNDAKVEQKDGRWIFRGLDNVGVTETKGNDKYEFYGCRGHVNVEHANESSDQDYVYTSDRTFNSGLVQKSNMEILVDRNSKVIKTKNDSIFGP